MPTKVVEPAIKSAVEELLKDADESVDSVHDSGQSELVAPFKPPPKSADSLRAAVKKLIRSYLTKSATLWRQAQVRAGLPSTNEYQFGTIESVYKQQAELLKSDAWVDAAINFAADMRRVWSVQRLAEWVSVKAGEAALLKQFR